MTNEKAKLGELLRQVDAAKHEVSSALQRLERVQLLICEYITGKEYLPINEAIPEISLSDLGFTQRTFNCLRRAGFLTLRKIAEARTPDEFFSIRGFGKRCLAEVRAKLAEYGLSLLF